MPNNKFEMKIRQDDDSFVCEITNGSISICVSNDGEEEDMQAIVDALNKPNVKWYSNNKLELDQHIEIMQLQEENEALKQQVATLHEKKKRGAEVHRKLFLAHMALQQQHQELKEKLQQEWETWQDLHKGYNEALESRALKANLLVDIIDQYFNAPKGQYMYYRMKLQNALQQWKEGKEVTDKQRLARTVVAIAEDVSKDAESAEAYLKSEGMDVEKAKAEAAYFGWKGRLMAIVTEHTGHTAVINDEEARKWYTDGFTPEQCFREIWQSDGD